VRSVAFLVALINKNIVSLCLVTNVDVRSQKQDGSFSSIYFPLSISVVSSIPLDCCAHGLEETSSSIDHAFAIDDDFLQPNETAVATTSPPPPCVCSSPAAPH
jgi:hypothetical protein